MNHFGESPRITGRAVLANLPRHIAARELTIVAERFALGNDALEIVDTKNSAGSGNVAMVECHMPDAVHVFTGFGRLGVSAEQVAEEATQQAQEFIGRRVAVDEHLADQILLPLALGEGGSFSTTKLSNHALTNMMVIKMFLNTEFQTASSMGDEICEVRVLPRR